MNADLQKEVLNNSRKISASGGGKRNTSRKNSAKRATSKLSG